MKKLIIANWKMQLDYKKSISLAQQYVKNIKVSKYEVVACPDFVSLANISLIFKKTEINLGAQDSAPAEKGAYTGEVSAFSLKSLGVKYVVLGHSERRQHLHENSALIRAKIQTALQAGLIPILCIGEKMAERKNKETKKYLAQELRHALKGLKIKNSRQLIIAYEPIWAISSHKNSQAVNPLEANNIHKFIQDKVLKIVGKKVRVLYGGSVNSKNSSDFLTQDKVAGLLIGRAALNLKEFKTICL